MKDIQKASNSHSTIVEGAYKKNCCIATLEKTPE